MFSALAPVLAEVHTGGLTLDDVLSQIQEAQQGVSQLRFSFQQRRSGVQSLTRVGTVLFRTPDQLRVEQLRPEKQVLVSDGDRVTVYMPAQQQAIDASWNEWAKSSAFPDLLLKTMHGFNPNEWRKDYDILFGGHDGTSYELIFKPHSSALPKLTLWVSDRTFWPVRARWNQPDGLYDVTINSLVPNVRLKDEAFKLKLPSGTARIPWTS